MPTVGEKLTRDLRELEAMSAAIDNANNATDYQVRVVTLGLATRAFLRNHLAALLRSGSTPQPVVDPVNKKVF